MKSRPANVQGLHFLVGDLDSERVRARVKSGPDGQSRSRLGCGNQVDHHLMAGQGASPPVLRDPGRHAVLDAVPLAGSRREMADRHFQALPIRKFLEPALPQAVSATVRASPVCRDQQPPGIRVVSPAHP